MVIFTASRLNPWLLEVGLAVLSKTLISEAEEFKSGFPAAVGTRRKRAIM